MAFYRLRLSDLPDNVKSAFGSQGNKELVVEANTQAEAVQQFTTRLGLPASFVTGSLTVADTPGDPGYSVPLDQYIAANPRVVTAIRNATNINAPVGGSELERQLASANRSGYGLPPAQDPNVAAADAASPMQDPNGERFSGANMYTRHPGVVLAENTGGKLRGTSGGTNVIVELPNGSVVWVSKDGKQTLIDGPPVPDDVTDGVTDGVAAVV